jgi:hypothetical protein
MLFGMEIDSCFALESASLAICKFSGVGGWLAANINGIFAPHFNRYLVPKLNVDVPFQNAL